MSQALTPKKGARIVVAMSGGVDSSVAAGLVVKRTARVRRDRNHVAAARHGPKNR